MRNNIINVMMVVLVLAVIGLASCTSPPIRTQSPVHQPSSTADPSTKKNAGTVRFQVGGPDAVKAVTTEMELKTEGGQLFAELKPNTGGQPFCVGLPIRVAALLPYPRKFERIYWKQEGATKTPMGVVLQSEAYPTVAKKVPTQSGERDLSLDFKQNWYELRSTSGLLVPLDPFAGSMDISQGLLRALRDNRVIWFSGSVTISVVDPSDGREIEKVKFDFGPGACAFWDHEKNEIRWANIDVTS